MKIIVLTKQTPDTETKIVLSSDKQKIDYKDTKFTLSAYDEFAIEEALQIKQRVGESVCEVVLLSFGPADVKERLIKGLAMGADRGLIIENKGFEDLDSLGIAHVLSSVIQKEGADLVLCGKQGLDDDNMHVGMMTAELLGWPHVNVVTKLALESPHKTARVEREVEGGMVEVFELTLPAVFGAHKSLNTPRYAALPGIMKAKKKPMDVRSPQDCGVDLEKLKSLARTFVESYQYPPEKPKGRMFQGEPVEVMVDKVVKLLREEAKVI
ncbi:MAG: electron transfer flavoprotein subunit beta/FixA family protein [Oligoflexales bacterium]|nr:electron transfer flavoprotein subunit beta/FixA family protein [Oligoflexales bacterium]